MAFQFVHIKTYSRKPDKQGRSVSFVLDEARREAAACQHIAEPLPPVVIHGVSPAEVELLHDRMVSTAKVTHKDGKERRLRVDQHSPRA